MSEHAHREQVSMRSKVRLLTSSIVVVLCLISLLMLGGCLRDLGQRISLAHDAETDTTTILIFRDGFLLHEPIDIVASLLQRERRPHRRSAAEREERAQYLIGRIVNEECIVDSKPGADRSDFESILATNVRTAVVGRYTDAFDRTGILQKITIRNSTTVLKHLNKEISRFVLQECGNSFGECIFLSDEDEWRHSDQQIYAAAAKGDYQWVSLDGNALRVQMPVHPREWMINGRQLLGKLQDGTHDFSSSLGLLVGNLAPSAFTLDLTHTGVTMVFGSSDVEGSFAIRHCSDMADSEEVRQAIDIAVANDVLEQLACHILSEEPEASDPALDAVLDWGPPEIYVAALLSRLEGESDDQDRARRLLQQFAENWNMHMRLPRAPVAAGNDDGGLEPWRIWLREAQAFPSVIAQQ